MNKAKAIADLKAVSAAGKMHGGKLRSVFKMVGKAAVAGFAIAAAAGAGIFIMAIKKAAEFEQAMAMVQSVTGATADEFAALEAKAKELGKTSKFTMTEIGAGMEFLGRAGFETNEIISAMDGVVALASSQVMDLGRAADITSNILTGMGLAADEAGRVADVLAQTAASANVTVEMLGESFKYAAPLAAAAGWSIEETAAAIGKMGDAGIQGSMAGTALRFALAELIGESENFTDKLGALGLKMDDLKGPDGQLLGMAEVFGVFEEKGFGAAEMLSLFGKRAGPGMAILLKEGGDSLAAYTDELENAGGAAQRMADIQLDTLSGQLTILKGSWDLLLVTIGTDLMPILKNLLKDRIIPIVNNMTSWIEKMGGLKGILAKLKGKIKAWVKEHEPFISALIRAKDEMVGLWNAVVNAFSEIIDAFWWGGAEADTFAFAFERALTIAVDIVAILLGVFTRFIDFLADHKEATIAVVAGIGAAFIAWKVTVIVASLGSIATGLWGMATAALAAIGPAGWVALLIGAIAVLAVRTIQEWDRIKEEGVLNWAGIIGMPTDAEWANWARQLWNGFLGLLPSDAQIARLFTGWMPGWLKKWLGVGKDAGQALKDGFREEWVEGEMWLIPEEVLEEKVKETVRDLKDTFREEWVEGGMWLIPEEVFEETMVDAARMGTTIIDAAAVARAAYLAMVEAVREWRDSQRESADDAVEIHRSLWTKIKDGFKSFWGDLVAGWKDFWGDFKADTKEGAGVVGAIWSDLSDRVGDTVGKIVQGIFDYYRDTERAAEDHANRMLDIDERYDDNTKDLQERHQDDLSKAALAYSRKLEDIEKDRQRDWADIARGDFEARLKLEARYREWMEDAAIDYARRREDIEAGYSKAVTDLADKRTEAINDEVQTYEDSVQPIWEALWEIVKAALAAAREELWVLSAVELAKAAAYQAAVFFGGLWAQPLATQHAAAGATALGEALALGLGGYMAGFKEGAVFDRPTLLPAHMVAETGYKEAYLPLSPSVFGEIGRGIVNALSVSTPVPALAAAGVGGINVDMRGLYDGATIYVRDDHDIEQLARETHDLWEARMRAIGRTP